MPEDVQIQVQVNFPFEFTKAHLILNRDYMSVDWKFWREHMAFMKEQGLNMVLVDIGEAVFGNSRAWGQTGLPAQRLEAGDHVEQFLVDAALTQAVKGAAQILQQFVDVLVGPFHRRQAARVLARERFGTGPEE